MTLPELLSDTVRARIYLEVLLNGEVTAQQLMEKIRISRSTMSHHLARFVDEGVFNVRIQESGRSVKFYSHNPEFSKEIVIEGCDDATIKDRIVFLESAVAHLNVISSLLREKAQHLRDTHAKPQRNRKVGFTFTLMSKEEAAIWNEEYFAFQKRFEEHRKSLNKASSSYDYIGFGGITPSR